MLEEEVGLQGTIDVSRSDALDTLDEPVKDTLVHLFTFYFNLFIVRVG
jgi:hypothetical protein